MSSLQNYLLAIVPSTTMATLALTVPHVLSLIHIVKSLTTMLKTSLIKSKGRFDEEELRAVFAEHGMDVRSAKRFIGSLLESRTEEGLSLIHI